MGGGRGGGSFRRGAGAPGRRSGPGSPRSPPLGPAGAARGGARRPPGFTAHHAPAARPSGTGVSGCVGPPAHPPTPLPNSCSHSSARPGAPIPPDFGVSDPETLPRGAHVTGRGGGGREGYTFTSDPPAATPGPLPHTQLQDLRTLGAQKGGLWGTTSQGNGALGAGRLPAPDAAGCTQLPALAGSRQGPSCLLGWWTVDGGRRLVPGVRCVEDGGQVTLDAW